MDIENQKLCSGNGQFYSPKDKTFQTVTLSEIISSLDNPTSTPKEKSRWVIPSTLKSRVHAEQREKGNFTALWSDYDEGSISFDDLVGIAGEIVRSDFIAYTSRSATQDRQKARIVIPLAYPVTGQHFVILQTILNNKLETAGIVPDRASERAGQLCYLPNKGEFYQSFYSNSLGPFDPAIWTGEADKIHAAQKSEQERLAGLREQSRIKAVQRVQNGQHDVMEAYKAAYDIPTMLDYYGYMRKGKRWLSPNSSSKVPGVTITDDGQKWMSAHQSDSGIGLPTSNGSMGDAFDLFKYYECGNDTAAALKAAGDLFMVGDVTMNKANQREYMKDKETLKSFDEMKIEGIPFDLGKFALNGESKDMEAKMLDDKYILDGIALLGQSTIIYSQPNVGKTLLTIYLLIDAIKKGELKGQDVYYINADDNHKGLTHKLKIAEQHSFSMLCPGYKEFKADLLAPSLKRMIDAGNANGKVLVLDTAKKFTDIMRKDKSSEFAEQVRQFVSHGGSVIMLAHVNKHRNDDGKVIYAGTSDLVDDCDCAYTLDIVSEDKFEGGRTVKFENFKNRGDVEREVVYEYDSSKSISYKDRLESVRRMGEQEVETVEEMGILEKKYIKNKEAIDALRNVLRTGDSMMKTELIKKAMAESGIGKRKIIRALDDHVGFYVDKFQFWKIENIKNSIHFTLNIPF